MNHYKKKNVLSIAAAHLLHDTFTSFFAPLLPLLIEKLGFTYTVAGMLSIVQRIPALFNPLIGLIADRIVIRSAIVAAPIVSIITMSLLGWAPSITLLGVLFFTSGISAAVFHVTAPILMRQVSGDRIGKGMSFFMFGGEMARTLGPLLITAAVSWWGLEGTWRLIPFGLVASLLLFLNLRSIDKNLIQQHRKSEQTSIRDTLKETAPFFGTIAPILLFRGFSKTAVTLFLPAYLVQSGHSIKVAAAALAFLELTGAGGTLLAGSLSDRIGRKSVLLFIMILSPLLLYLFTLTSGVGQWILLGLIGLIIFSSMPVFLAMIHDLNSDRPSFINGIFMTLNFIAGSSAALFVGAFADHVGFVTTFQIAAVVSLLAIPFTCMIRSNK